MVRAYLVRQSYSEGKRPISFHVGEPCISFPTVQTLSVLLAVTRYAFVLNEGDGVQLHISSLLMEYLRWMMNDEMKRA